MPKYMSFSAADPPDGLVVVRADIPSTVDAVVVADSSVPE
jgi:hypothetical protein